MVLDLRTTDRNLDSNVFAKFIAICDLGSNNLIEEKQDFFIRHFLHLRADCQVSRCNRGIAKLDYCIISIARDYYLIQSGDTWFLFSHIRYSPKMHTKKVPTMVPRCRNRCP